MSIREAGDCVEQFLRIDIVSDTPDKIDAYRKAICDWLFDEAAKHDVAVSIHDITESTP